MLNVKVDRKELLKAVQVVENAVSENKIREVLSGIYIEATENKIILKGTDLELSINTEIVWRMWFPNPTMEFMMRSTKVWRWPPEML